MQRSAQTPAVHELRQRMLHALEKESYVELCYLLPAIGADALAADDVPTMKLAKTHVALTDPICWPEAARLLHSIPRDLLRSLVRNTVAHDFLQPENRPVTYGGMYAGTYVVAVAIDRGDDGPVGTFLSRNELLDVVNRLREYVQAHKAVKPDDGSNWREGSADIVQARTILREIDQQFGSSASNPSRFIKSKTSLRRVQALIEQLERRMDPELDPVGDTPQIQSPLMVGCTEGTMFERTQCHHPEVKSLHGTTYTWALFLSALQYCGYKPIVKSVPVIAACRSDDLPLSEMLVTSLARSLVTQDGFNITGGGGLTTDEEIVEQERYVLCETPFVRDNLARSVGCLRRQLEIHTTAERILTASRMAADRSALNELSTQLMQVEERVIAFRSQQEEANRVASETEEAASDATDRVNAYNEVLDLLLAGVRRTQH